MQKRLFFLVAMLLTLSLTALAQITTSSMAGKVTIEGTGEEVIGATVQAIHEPSGTRYNAVTNASGRFAIQGMRTGGPYAVTVTYIGFQPKTLKSIVLQLGETYNLQVWLSEDATELAEVVISGKASKFTAEKTGASTNINSQQILNLPTVNRSITDVTRLSPYGGNGMSFAGADGRTANFTVDGANFNNNFGLSDKLPGGGNPISIDAIEELQVVISPYDVRQTNFIGGGVNAITKSGTNTFRGTAYIYHQNENLRGDAVETALGTREEHVRRTRSGFPRHHLLARPGVALRQIKGDRALRHGRHVQRPESVARDGRRERMSAQIQLSCSPRAVAHHEVAAHGQARIGVERDVAERVLRGVLLRHRARERAAGKENVPAPSLIRRS